LLQSVRQGCLTAEDAFDQLPRIVGHANTSTEQESGREPELPVMWIDLERLCKEILEPTATRIVRPWGAEYPQTGFAAVIAPFRIG
jgi:hypothetical protein